MGEMKAILPLQASLDLAAGEPLHGRHGRHRRNQPGTKAAAPDASRLAPHWCEQHPRVAHRTVPGNPDMLADHGSLLWREIDDLQGVVPPATREPAATARTGDGGMLDPLIHLGHAIPSPVVGAVSLLPRPIRLLLLRPRT